LSAVDFYAIVNEPTRIHFRYTPYDSQEHDNSVFRYFVLFVHSFYRLLCFQVVGRIIFLLFYLKNNSLVVALMFLSRVAPRPLRVDSLGDCCLPGRTCRGSGLYLFIPGPSLGRAFGVFCQKNRRGRGFGRRGATLYVLMSEKNVLMLLKSRGLLSAGETCWGPGYIFIPRPPTQGFCQKIVGISGERGCYPIFKSEKNVLMLVEEKKFC